MSSDKKEVNSTVTSKTKSKNDLTGTVVRTFKIKGKIYTPGKSYKAKNENSFNKLKAKNYIK